MDNNPQTLAALNTAFTTAFNTAFYGAETTYQRICMTVNSTTASNTYPKLSDMPRMREWLGDRVINRFGISAFEIVNRKFENTIAIGVDEIDDDQVGIYSTTSADFGQTAAELPDDLAWEQVELGFDTAHYDGQNFFDPDHPVEDESGNEQSVSNFTDGAGPAWYLIDDTKVIKPFIFQDRLAAQFKALMDMSDPNVAFSDEYMWLAKRRCATGFGSWQLAQASKQPLTPESYAAARRAMLEMRGYQGRKLNLRPSLLVVNAANEGAARDILMSERIAGSTNKWRNTADLHVEGRLSA